MDNRNFVPIYKKLTEFYRDKIMNQELPPGHKIDSINKIMQRHGVSRETAKLVLKNLREEGVVISKAGKGSFVNMQSSVKRTWGLIVPIYTANVEQLIGYLEEEAQERGRELRYFLDYNDASEEKRLVSEMVFKGYEAVIVVPNYDESLTADFYRKLVHGKTKVIFADNTMTSTSVNYIVQSYDLGIKRALAYLTSHVKGNLMLAKNRAWKGRNLLNEHVENTFNNLVGTYYPERKAFVVEQIRKLDKSFFTKNNIEGVLCNIDTDAVKIIGMLKEWQIDIPGQVRLVSYGNTELTALFSPAITVIDCLYQEMAGKISQLIENEMENNHSIQHIIQPKLIVRET